MSKKIKLAVVGASGRTGSQVVDLVSNDDSFELCSAVVSEKSKVVNCAVPGKASAAHYTSDIRSALREVDVCIDFSVPEISVLAAEICAERNIPILIATTGFTEEQRVSISKQAKCTAVLVAPNTSLVVFAARQLSKLAKKILGSSYDVEVFDLHHRHKRDLPSGTALSLARSVQEVDNSLKVVLRNPQNQLREANDIGVTGLRAGGAPGEHTVFFVGENDRLEITQRAYSRSVFARGAIQLASLLVGRAPGLYAVEDMFPSI